MIKTICGILLIILVLSGFIFRNFWSKNDYITALLGILSLALVAAIIFLP
jgi:hypothetical protein